MITCKSLTDSTANTAISTPDFLIVPTPSVHLIASNIAISFICSFIKKLGDTLQLVFILEFGRIETEKQPSASENPVTNHGFNLGYSMEVENCALFNWLEGILS